MNPGRENLSLEDLKAISYSLPEGTRREDILLRAGSSDTKKLAELPDETPLDVRFDGRSFSRDDRTFVPLPTLSEAPPWTLVRSNLPPSFFCECMGRSRRHFSFSGTQQKFTARLVVEDETPTLEDIDETKEVGNVIVKPWDGKYPFLPENEFFSIMLMDGMGLPTVVPRLARTDCMHLHLVVERFDLDIINGMPQRRRAFQLAELMELSTDENGKYSITTEELLDFVCAHLENPRRFALAYAAGWAIGNGDMHAKNFSAFAASNGKYRLAPLYDILNTTVYEGMTDRLALPFGECCSPSPDGRDFLGYLAERFGSDLLDELYFLLFKVPTIAERILERMTPSINDNPRRAAFLTRLADRSSKLAQTALRDIDAVMDRTNTAERSEEYGRER